MKSNWILTTLGTLALGLAAFTVTGCNKSDHEHGAGEQPGHEHSAAAKYTCSMHPEVVQDKPSDCPKCGMKLVEKKWPRQFNTLCRRVDGESPQTNTKTKTMNTVAKTLALAMLAGATTLLFNGCASDGHEHHHGMAAAKPYPLTTCIVSGEAFEHGKPYVFVHDGQEIKLCCKDCLADFQKDPAKYLAKLGAAK